MGDQSVHAAKLFLGAVFYGKACFHHTFPCDPSGLGHFRKRIGEQGAATILSYSVAKHEFDGRVNQALSDTAVQENDLAFPMAPTFQLENRSRKCNTIRKLGTDEILQNRSY